MFNVIMLEDGFSESPLEQLKPLTEGTTVKYFFMHSYETCSWHRLLDIMGHWGTFKFPCLASLSLLAPIPTLIEMVSNFIYQDCLRITVVGPLVHCSSKKCDCL